jgi:hypothetical protein
MRHQTVVAIVASGVAVGAGLAVAPIAQASSGGSQLPPHYVTSELVSSKARPSGYLGAEVAISGKTVVVDADSTRADGQPDAGAVYVFTRSKSGKGRLTQRAVLSIPDEYSYEEVGPVAVSGNTIVIGAQDAEIGGTAGAGAAYVFVKPASGWKSTSHPTATLTLGAVPSEARVGESVAIAGNTIVAGAPELTVGANDNQGAVLVYTKPAHGWASSHTPAELTSATGSEDDYLGESVAIAGNTIVAGAPYRETSGHDEAGIADVFVKPHSGWTTGTETRELDTTTAITDLQFGYAVAVSGRHVAVSAIGEASTSLYVHSAVFEVTEPLAGWGAGVDPPLHPNARLTTAHGGPYDSFGQSIAISGSMIIVGAPYASLKRKYDSGAVYVYYEPKSGWHNATQSKQFIASNTERWDSLGYSVASSGSTIVAGAPYADYTGGHASYDRGAAYVFSKQAKHHRSKVEVAK